MNGNNQRKDHQKNVNNGLQLEQPPRLGMVQPTYIQQPQPMGHHIITVNGPPHPLGRPVLQQPYPPHAIPRNDAPIPGNWMVLPESSPDCPPGLEYLTVIDQLLVQQKVETMQGDGFINQTSFRIKNNSGQDVYYAQEESNCILLNCLTCTPIQPFYMRIYDNVRNEVIQIHRPLACDACCFPCCLQTMEISSPPDNLIGTIYQEWGIFSRHFTIKNPNDEILFKIQGPFFTCSCCCNDVDFKVTTPDGTKEVGKITKQWSGFLKEAFTDADNFGISFPMDLDVKMKAIMLGACFLIDAMYFKSSNTTRRRTHRRY